MYMRTSLMDNIRSKPAYEAWQLGDYASNSKDFSTKDNALSELRHLWKQLQSVNTVEEYDRVYSRIGILSSLVI